MESNQDSFRILGLLETSHGFESCIEAADVVFNPVRGCLNVRINEVLKAIAARFLES